MSVPLYLRSLFSTFPSARRRAQGRLPEPRSVELLENRTLLTLVGMTATVHSTFQAAVQTGGVEVPAAGPVSAVVSEETTTPEFAQFDGTYDINIGASSIAMTFHPLNGSTTPPRVVEAGTFERYVFKFDIASNETISSAVADSTATLVPNVSILGRDTVVVEIGPGMQVGNGFNALIDVQVARTGTVITGRKFHDFNGDGAHTAGEAWLNGWVVQLLDINQNSTVVATATTADIDLNGDGSIDPASERGVYEFVNVPASTYQVQEVQRPGWSATVPSASASDAAFQLDQTANLQAPSNTFLNWGGLQEKWLFGGGSWYFITPNGDVFQWDGSPQTNLTGSLVAQLNPVFYNDLSRLYDAQTTRQYVADIDGTVNSTHRGLTFGNDLGAPDFTLTQNSDNSVTFNWTSVSGQTYDVWIADVNTGRRFEVTEGITGSTFTSGILPARRYRVWMRANAPEGVSSPWTASQEFEFTRGALTNPVTAGLDAGIDATPTLVMAPQDGATEYSVRVTNSAGTIVYEGSGGASHRVARALRLGTYGVSVRVKFADGSRTDWSADQTLLIDGRPVVTASGTVFSWAPVAAATQYEIWIDRVDAGGRQLQRQVVSDTGVQQTSFTPTGLARGRYAIWVRAIRAEGGATHVSFWSGRTDFQVTSLSDAGAEVDFAAESLQMNLLARADDVPDSHSASRPAATAQERDTRHDQPQPVSSEEEIVTAVMAELAGSDMLDRSLPPVG